LFSFGEYAAMYIYAFGNAPQWQPENDWSRLLAEGVDDPAAAEQAFIGQQAALHNFHGTLGKVRKLLANIPTYMLFDDHDVTDDWNITSDWYDNVRDSPLGRRIVANALAAYWAFQGWGNDPDNFDKDLQLSICQYLADRNNTAEIGERYDLHLWKHRGWSFSVPTDPPIIAIDSRTQRMATPDSYLPVLVDRYGLDWLKVEWAKLKTGQSVSSDSWPIFIAAAPVFGFSAMERMQKAIHWCAEQLENYAYFKGFETIAGLKGYLSQKVIRAVDVEAWTSNKQSFTDLMACLGQRMGIKQCVLLSGDVHYSFSAIGKHSSPDKKGKTGYTVECYQLTSSPLLNTAAEAQQIAVAKASQFSDGVSKHTAWWKALFPKLPFKAPETGVHLLPSQETATHVTQQCNLGLVQFEQGRPTQHVLLQGGNDTVYLLPDTFEKLNVLT
jgi:phosphodiesterase/alkaline phosphatase D-like protein